MADFKSFASKVHATFGALSKHELFTTIDGNELWLAYLAAFPEGTDPIYKTNTMHTCSCCKHFVRNIGNVVAVIDGKMHSVWGDHASFEYPYNVVAEKLNELVLDQMPGDIFRRSSKESVFGAEISRQLREDGTVHNWNHFHGRVEPRHVNEKPDEARGNYRTTVEVFRRGLEELSKQALDDVLGLIDNNALYRGEEHRPALTAFRRAKQEFSRMTPRQQGLYVWMNAGSPVSRFRNTVIGTLVQDLSEGKELEQAVKSFESKVAPTNYKRPTALITPRMVDDAMKTINELGLEEALTRRFAKISDVSVNNVLWVDNVTSALMKGGLHNTLMQAATAPTATIKDAQDISITDFLANVLPTLNGLELMVKNTQVNNFVSLTAPVGDDVPALFKWDNNFAWSYEGNITDSIKELVKKAGGNTGAAFRVSLAWYNHDDLDIHVTDPAGHHIYFANRMGKLDVDMNAFGGLTRTPVENVSWSQPQDGTYTVIVNNFSKRETSGVGFTIEVESRGRLEQYSYTAALRQSENVGVGKFTLKNGVLAEVQLGVGLIGGTASKKVWNVDTEKFIKVQTVMHSPNYWDDNKVGNRHTIFVLEGCKNDLPTRGIYNEFLKPEMEKHRKVFEVLGDKTKCPVTDEQISGVGFSSTKGDTVTVKATSVKTQRTFNIVF
jgi:hypothetical protein